MRSSIIQDGDPMSKSKRLRERVKNPVSPLQVEIMKAYSNGYQDGAKMQRLADFKQMMDWIDSLQEIPGVGERTAFKIGQHFLKNYAEGEKDERE